MLWNIHKNEAPFSTDTMPQGIFINLFYFCAVSKILWFVTVWNEQSDWQCLGEPHTLREGFKPLHTPRFPGDVKDKHWNWPPELTLRLRAREGLVWKKNKSFGTKLNRDSSVNMLRTRDHYWGPPNFLPNGYRGLFLRGVKRPSREADHSPPSRAEIIKKWIYTSTPPYAFMA
jgi:hypothetical protein